MLEACRESRHSGKMVEKLVEGIAVQVSLSGYTGDEDFEWIFSFLLFKHTSQILALMSNNTSLVPALSFMKCRS